MPRSASPTSSPLPSLPPSTPSPTPAQSSATQSVPLRPASPRWQQEARKYLETHVVDRYPPLRPPSPEWQLEAIEYCRTHVEPLPVPIEALSAPEILPPPGQIERRPLYDRLRAAQRTIHEQRLHLHSAMQRCDNVFSGDGSIPGRRMQGYYSQLAQWDEDLKQLISTDEENGRRGADIQDLLQSLVAALLQLTHMRGDVPKSREPRPPADWW